VVLRLTFAAALDAMPSKQIESELGMAHPTVKLYWTRTFLGFAGVRGAWRAERRPEKAVFFWVGDGAG
jgi:hypothetical protein